MPLNVKLYSKPVKCYEKAFEVGRERIYTTNKARFSQSDHQLVSFDANTCSILSLNGGNNRNCLMHIAPEQQPLSTLKDGVAKCIKALREKMVNFEDNITGVLVGGRNLANTDSYYLFNEIANILDQFEIPFSMICGKYDSIKNDNIITTGNTVKIWNNSLKDLNIPKGTNGDELKEILEQNYEVVEFSSEAPVTFIG